MRDQATSVTTVVSFRRLAHEWTETHFEDTPNFQAVLRRIALFVDHIGLKQAKS